MSLRLNDDPRVQPFELGSGPRTCVLVHGFTGTPFEMRFLGERLADRGFRVRGLRLPGHGVDPEEFATASAEDWVEHLRSAVREVASGDRVFLCGLSMGALLSLIVASEMPDQIQGLALLAPALRLQGPSQLYLQTFSRTPLIARVVPFVTKSEADLLDPEVKAANPLLRKVPTRSAAHLDRVMSWASAALPEVKAPALIMHSSGDRTVPRSAVLEVAERIGSRPARMMLFEKSHHVMTVDVDRVRVAQEVGDFFQGLITGSS